MRFDNRLLIIQVLFFILISFSIAYARHFEPGEFEIALIGDRTGNLKDVGIANKEIKFADTETGTIVYSRTYDNSTWYPQCNFSPDGRTLYILWQAAHAYQGGTSAQIELIDIYNNRVIKRYDVIYGHYWDVTFSLCSNIAYVTRYSSAGGGSGWNIGYSLVDLKTYSAIKEGNITISGCTPPTASITADGKNIRLTSCRGDILNYPLPDSAIGVSNDPDPVMPPVTVIAEGLIEGSAAYKSFRYLSSLAKKTLNKVFQSSTFPVIKYAVRVIGSDGRTISGLGAGSFQVKENGVVQTITGLEFQNTNVPVDIALCLDTSGSISDTELTQINSSAGKFIDCFSSSDRGAIYKFSSNVKLIQGFSSDKDSLKNAINASPPERAVTSLNDAVYDAMALCRQSQNRKAVVAITDGYDNDSSHSLQGIIDYSSENQVPVFTLGLGSPLNVSLLQSMAAQCRGIYFNAITVNKLEEVFNKVAEDVRSRYIITYTTNNPIKDGTTRSVETTVVNGASSGSATFQYLAPLGVKPVAQIVSISPEQVFSGQTVTFQGIGADSDGTITEYSWRSSIDGVIGNQETFQSSSLSAGNHTIFFKVKDSDGFWSDEVSKSLVIMDKVTVSGKIRYENRIFNETGTGDPEAVEFKSVRFAKVEIIRASDKAVVGTGQTEQDGTYKIEIKAVLNDKVYLKCYSYTSEKNQDYHIAVIKDFNPSDSGHYKESEQKTVSQDSLTIDLDITEESGEGGAFNIFDCLVDGIDKVRELNGSTLPPPPIIPVIWKKGVERKSCAGNSININGINDNPDEYDDSVILHEYGHFIMHNYSGDNSPAGNHNYDDTNQDIRLSWSEGWATFFSCMVRNNPAMINVYKDVETENDVWISGIINVETLFYNNRFLLDITTGQDAETAVSSIFWDIYDSADDDADTLSLGMQPIWEAFRKINTADDCVLEDFYNYFFINSANEAYRNQVNNIFASRKVFYSDSTFKRGEIFMSIEGPKEIPDGRIEGMPSSEIEVSEDVLIKDINVFVDITQKHDGSSDDYVQKPSDLVVTLISPLNQEFILHNHLRPSSGQAQDIFAWYQEPYETIPYCSLPIHSFDSNFKSENAKGIWKLKAVDSVSHEFYSTFNRWKLEIKGWPAKIEFSLQPGWNFVSFPLLPEDKSISNVLSSIQGNYSQVSRYSALTKTFEHYVGDVNYDQFNSIEYSRGYQIFVTNPVGCKLIIAGKPVIDPQSIILKAGWNLIGSIKLDELPVEETLMPLQLGIEYSKVCRYNPLITSFENYMQDKKEFSVLKVGEAYYLKCQKDVKWSVEGP